MSNVTADKLGNANASVRTDLINQWKNNVDLFPQFAAANGWTYTVLNQSTNQSVLMSILNYNTSALPNATRTAFDAFKSYVRAEVDAGRDVVLMNTTGNTSYAQSMQGGRAVADPYDALRAGVPDQVYTVVSDIVRRGG